jgi:hypothetical protein
MPRFFFDLRDGELIRDDEGVELRDLDEALAQAKTTLAEMVQERSQDKATEHLMIDVRQEGSSDVFSVVATTLVEHTKNVPRP